LGRLSERITLIGPMGADVRQMDIHALAIQMGTSIGMIERHYSHLTPRLKKDMLTGKRYELSREEFEGLGIEDL
jgi:hypothetical protein